MCRQQNTRNISQLTAGCFVRMDPLAATNDQILLTFPCGVLSVTDANSLADLCQFIWPNLPLPYQKDLVLHVLSLYMWDPQLCQ